MSTAPPLPGSPATVGASLPRARHDWLEADAILYALGVGATPPQELALLYEDDHFAVLPTFALIANWWAVKDLGTLLRNDGLPLVHAHQSLELLRPLGRQGSVEVTSTITGVWDAGKHTLIELGSQGSDSEGPLFHAMSGTMILGLHGWGGDPGPTTPEEPTKEQPLASFDDYVRPEQASIYRLSGDRNPLHIDPEAARAAGFPDVFLHGLCTLGFAARAVVNAVGGGDAAALRSIRCRFSKPVQLGQSLRTEIWSAGPETFTFTTSQSGRPALTRGQATLWGG